MRFLRLWVGALALLAAACAAGEDDSLGGRAQGGEGGTVVPTTGGAGGVGATGGAGGAGGDVSGGGGSGGGLSGAIELCVLNEGEAFDACQQPEELDFGVVSSGSTEMRMFRVDNETPDELLFTDADVSDSHFDVVAVRFEEDPGDPGTYLRIEEELPFARQSGQSLWFEVSYAALGSQGPIPDEDVIVSMNLDGQAIADLEVPVKGERSGCPSGSAACDADPNNGCETDTDTSEEHCGACNTPCNPFNGVGECVAGDCTLTGCDPFQENCDNNPDNGCEVSLLNDVEHCGSCTNSCIKANTSSACAAGNCSIVGCLNNYGDCNLSPLDGCEINLANNMANCGGCNLPCALDNAAESCVPNLINGLGVCTLGPCDAGFANCNLDPVDGCEIDTETDVDNCGGCFSPCDFDNAADLCVAGDCELGMCNAGFANCDAIEANGCEVELATNKDHCGTCATDCDVVFPGSSVSCSANACQFNGCLPNFWNLDGNLANGCEYSCTFVAGPDNPDNSFVDSNCDGIDGDANAAIFVATTGNDGWPGTRAQPMLTINAALGKAQTDGKTQVYVSNGIYSGRVTLVNGISIYGGYSASNNWARSVLYISTIRSTVVSGGRVNALEGINITGATRVDRMRVETFDTATAGTSNYAVYCNNCDGLTLSNNDIEAGNGGGGGTGSNGTPGANGGNGGNGGPGHCSNNSPGGAGGSGATSTCGRAGGAGGAGGNYGDNDGQPGATGQVGTSGGSGGSGGDPGGPGSNGNNGTNGSLGASGAAGSGGTVSASFWLSDAGGNGGSGTAGNGGGGGGGGGGQGCFFCDDAPGNGGGGGGSGGCGGTAGGGSIGGGGSFGVFLVGSTGIVLTANTIQSGNGGQGGTGGAGGSGGSGGNGGNGNTVCAADVGTGGNGGDGGNGASGGGGGGGAGGPSWAVYRSGTTVSTAGNTLSNGAGGPGGNGGFPNGSSGVAGAAGSVN